MKMQKIITEHDSIYYFVQIQRVSKTTLRKTIDTQATLNEYQHLNLRCI